MIHLSYIPLMNVKYLTAKMYTFVHKMRRFNSQSKGYITLTSQLKKVTWYIAINIAIILVFNSHKILLGLLFMLYLVARKRVIITY